MITIHDTHILHSTMEPARNVTRIHEEFRVAVLIGRESGTLTIQSGPTEDPLEMVASWKGLSATGQASAIAMQLNFIYGPDEHVEAFLAAVLDELDLLKAAAVSIQERVWRCTPELFPGGNPRKAHMVRMGLPLA